MDLQNISASHMQLHVQDRISQRILTEQRQQHWYSILHALCCRRHLTIESFISNKQTQQNTITMQQPGEKTQRENAYTEFISYYNANYRSIGLFSVFSERELKFMFAICRRPSVCLSVVLSSVCL